jgi:lipopolysaccharide biosynthesis glycosyltransferase
MNMYNVFLGYDEREALAYAVASHSMHARSSVLLNVKPISRQHVMPHRPVEMRDGRLWCPLSKAPMSTDFAIARFAVPRLIRRGWALFADCDILVLGDLAELFALADPRYAVMVVQHDYTADAGPKMDNQVQTTYPRKNWSSVILWNCEHPSNQRLNWHVLNTWPGRALHGFAWLADEEIGTLPLAWNFLVDVNTPEQVGESPPKLLHYTLGGPWFDRPCSYAEEWEREKRVMLSNAASTLARL